MVFSFKRVFISGATSGIGEALVDEILKYPLEALFLTGQNQKKLSELQQTYQSRVDELQLKSSNLNDINDRKILVSKLMEFNPDLVINNAGFGIYGDAIHSNILDHLSLAEVNGMAVFHITHDLCQMWIEKGKKGTVLNVSSIAGEYVFPGMALYSAIKKAVTQYSQALDFELKQKGVRVLVFCPGQVATSFAKRAASGHLKAYNPGLNITSVKAAKAILKQIILSKPNVVFDWRYHLLLKISKLFPKEPIKKILYRNILTRISR